MPVQFGFSIQLRILILWTVFSSKLLIGLLVAGGIHPHTVRESLQLIFERELNWPSFHQCHAINGESFTGLNFRGFYGLSEKRKSFS